MRLVLLALALLRTLAAGPNPLSLAPCEGPSRELASRGAFLLCHDTAYHTAVWTSYELTPTQLLGDASRPSRFRPDHDLPGAALDSDYRHSGYSRGHLVPAADQASSPESIAATFLLSNAVPMPISLNAGKWRQLEIAVRRLATHSDRVIVFTGPIFCPGSPRIGSTGVAVPCQLFKVVLAIREGRVETYAAVLPNTGNPAAPLDTFAASIDHVEQLTGLDFFPNLAPHIQHVIESTTTPFHHR